MNLRCPPIFLRGRLLAAATVLSLAAPAQAAVMISQVYGGGGNSGAPYTHDFVELHNSGTAAVSLAGWSVQYSSAAGTSWTNQKVDLSGSIAAGGYYLVQLGNAGGSNIAGVALPSAQASGPTINMGASAGKLALVNSTTSLPAETCPATNTTIVDMVGYGNTANCGEPLAAPTAAQAPSATLAIVRKATATSCQDSNSNSADFVTAAPSPRNTSTAPQACGTGSNPNPGGEAVAKKIYEIQGPGTTSPIVGQRVMSEGVVTLVTNNGFFMQDQQGDGNPLTSDGIFVFTNTTSYAAAVVGNLVKVTGTVVEFTVGTGVQALARPITEITTVTAVDFINAGFSITPTVVALPEAVEGELERYEGMLVTLTGPFTVSQNFFQGRYGQVTLSRGGRLQIPTNAYRPGSPQALALADANARNRIILDDGKSTQNPNPIPYLGANGTVPRAGDTTGSITGVIDYGLATNFADGISDYKIQPTAAVSFSVGNPRTVVPAPVGGNIKVASFNVLNYFTAYTDGGGTSNGCSQGGAVTRGNCRGADNAAEFTRQQTKIVKAMAAIDADVLGLMEIQNNGNTAAQSLVNALNTEVGAGTYATTTLPANVGDDAIRVAIIYKPAKLAPVGAAVSDNSAINNRPTLAQTFSVLSNGLGNGQSFSLFVNHFKSKGSCPAVGDADYAGNNDSGDGQGCWNKLRTAQATQLRNFVNQRQAATNTSAALIIGDLNAYGQEDPIIELTNNGYTDQARRFSAFPYSYVFDGAAGQLDHAIANAAMAALVNGVEHWRVNADEPSVLDYNTEFKLPATTCGTAGCPADPYQANPYRASDHDPVVIGLNLYSQVRMGTGGRDTLTATSGDNLFIGGVGADLLTGGPGNNGYRYLTMRDAGDTIVDFKPGKDRIDISELLRSINRTSATAYSEGVVRLLAAGAHTMVQIDVDGNAGPQLPRTLVTLLNISPAALQAKRDLGVQ